MHYTAITRNQMALIDGLMVKHGISVARMMETAALDTALLARKVSKGKNIVALCGRGNNGGDAIATLRHLAVFGFNCTIIFPFNPGALKGEPRKQLEIVRKIGLKIIQWDKKRPEAKLAMSKANLIVDGLIGYNLKGNPKKNFAALIDVANNSGKKILAIDVPSGLDATTGESFTPCINAHYTLCLTLPKTGVLKKKAKKYCGKIFAGYLGVPPKIFVSAKVKPKKWFASGMVEKFR